jgi:transcriptional regulator with XRE-family HTH domain
VAFIEDPAPDVFEETDIGSRLREVRIATRQTLKQVAERAGISEGFLSQIERGIGTPSVASLRRIVSALGLQMMNLFASDWRPEPDVLRREDRPQLRFNGLFCKSLLTPPLAHSLEVLIGAFDPGGSTGDEPYSHGDSEELLFVLSGHVRITLGGRTHDMEPGDSITYSSAILHKLEERSGEPAEVLWAISPPAY